MKADNESVFFPDDDEKEEIPSDALMAINSLIQSDQGIHVPISNNSIQAVLECQIYSKFEDNHASKITSGNYFCLNFGSGGALCVSHRCSILGSKAHQIFFP